MSEVSILPTDRQVEECTLYLYELEHGVSRSNFRHLSERRRRQKRDRVRKLLERFLQIASSSKYK